MTSYSHHAPALALAAFMLPLQLWAAWDGTQATGYAAGLGTKAQPYQIATEAQFAYFAQQVQANPGGTYGKYYVLTADLTFNPQLLGPDGLVASAQSPRECPLVGTFTSDTDYAAFQGTFDGQGHTISGYYSSLGKNHTSLFPWTEEATIRNLGLRDSYFMANAYSGAIVGRQMKATRVVNCWSDATVTGPGSNQSSGSNHGGISGWVFDGSSVTNCYFAGHIWGKNNIGGIAGRVGNNATSTGRIDNCYSIGTLKDNLTGVITSALYDGSAIAHCYGMGVNVLVSNTDGGRGTIDPSCDVKGAAELTSTSFLALLNAQYSSLDGVCRWVAGADGYPVHDYSTVKEEAQAEDFDLIATNPYPATGTIDADADDNVITLTWDVAPSTQVARQLLYVSTSETTLDASLVATLDAGTSHYTIDVPSLDVHYWRIDQQRADGAVSRGTVWNFRARQLAFPGADGGGRYTTGGRGGKVYHVTNLNDSGDGSLRWAIGKSGTRTIVFDVAGTIALQSPLKVSNGNVTIAGQTAPGDGICLKNYTFNISASNVIVRFIRCRMGDEKNSEDDAMNCYTKSTFRNIIIDHCSMSWSTDECASFYGVKDFTLQWCIIAEALNNSIHDKGKHGYGGIWGGQNASYHHNLIADNNSRNPRFDHYYVNQSAGLIDYTNNVVYNWGSNNTYGGETANDGAIRLINFVNNYYKPGPATSSRKDQFFNLTNKCDNCMKTTGHGSAVIPATVYLTGNVMEGNSSITADNWRGIRPDNTISNMTPHKATQPFAVTPLRQLHTAQEAFDLVLTYAGASLRRDAVDERVTSDARQGKATIKNGGNGSTNGLIDTPSAVGGWPELKATAEELAIVAKDSNANGIPDDREQELFGGLVDGNGHDRDGRYTNLEWYLDWLVRDVNPSAIRQVGIESLSAEPAACYNLMGQPVGQAAKGLVIGRGQKALIR